MVASLKVAVAICLGIAVAVASKRDNFFRRDYTYIEEYDAFYKLHWGQGVRTWEEAFLTCDDEGAKLFYPTDEEWRIAANLSDALVDVEYVFVGVRDEFDYGDFISPDEFSIKPSSTQSQSKCGVMSVTTGVYDVGSCEIRRPFICKKLNNEYCPTADSGYIFVKSLQICYKVNENKKIWASAMHTCIMEGGVLSSSIIHTDHNILRQLLKNDQSYFIGFKKISPRSDFYYTQGFKITISERNSYTDNAKDCAIFRLYNEVNAGDVNAGDCNTTLPFVCEMKVNV